MLSAGHAQQLSAGRSTPSSSTPPPPSASPSSLLPLFIELTVNDSAPQAARALRRPGGALLISRAELQGLRIALPASPAAIADGVAYDDIALLPGSAVDFDAATQTVHLRLGAAAFQATAVSAATTESAPPSPSTFGAFLNYDLVAQAGGAGRRMSGLVDASVSDAWGLATSSFLVGSRSNASVAGGGSGSQAIRLESAYRFDDPADLTRLTVGDAITQSAVWSTPMRFGGVQFGTQFGLRPGYISYPTPTLRGGSTLPSAVEVYVNDALRYRSQVEAGPFALTQLPVLTGAGEMRFTVTDALGVGRTVSTPYYVSTALLRPGLSDYSVELGWNRLHYGLASNDYGRPFASGNWRRGIDETLTTDLHGEASARTQIAGAGATWVWSSIGEFALHGALSRASPIAAGIASSDLGPVAFDAGRTGGTGRLFRASFAHLGSDWSFSAHRQVASAAFSQVGWEEGAGHVRAQTQLFAGRSLGKAGSLGLSHTVLNYDSGEHIALTSISYSVLLAERVFFSVYASRSRSTLQPVNTSIGVMMTVPFGDRQSASLSASRQNGKTTATVDVNQPPPSDTGWGYRVAASRGEIDRNQAQATWRAPYATLTAEAASERGESAARFTASGTLGVAGGRSFALQQPTDALALVTVEGAPGITVYRENQPVARTDVDGRAVIPGLRPYEINHLLIDSGELPISTRVRSEALAVVPRARGVAAVRFDIGDREGLSATVAVVMPDGKPLAAGSRVRAAARAEPLVAGFGGVLWVDQPVAGERFEARWRDGACSFEVGAIPASEILPNLGPYPCLPTP